ncbi:MAG: peptide chain release factor N(5)-glutamine methyltransferase [Candidatus Omnitrophota bacterium]
MTEVPACAVPGLTPATLGEWLLWAKDELGFLGEGEALDETVYLAREAFETGRAELTLHGSGVPDPEKAERFRTFILKRKQRIPAAYVCGRAYFRDETLTVDPACLIPRPETELLVEALVRCGGFEYTEPLTFLDLGTGSGAIAVSVLRHFERSRGVLSDLSPEVLEIARGNVAAYGLTARAEFAVSDLFGAFGGRRWKVILSNPPYVKRADLERLDEEVRSEPRLALDGGDDGLEFYRRILREASEHLTAKGKILLELGAGQAGPVRAMMEARGFKGIRIFRDHASIERVIMGESKEGVGDKR